MFTLLFVCALNYLSAFAALAQFFCHISLSFRVRFHSVSFAFTFELRVFFKSAGFKLSISRKTMARTLYDTHSHTHKYSNSNKTSPNIFFDRPTAVSQLRVEYDNWKIFQTVVTGVFFLERRLQSIWMNTRSWLGVGWGKRCRKLPLDSLATTRWSKRWTVTGDCRCACQNKTETERKGPKKQLARMQWELQLRFLSCGPLANSVLCVDKRRASTKCNEMRARAIRICEYSHHSHWERQANTRSHSHQHICTLTETRLLLPCFGIRFASR